MYTLGQLPYSYGALEPFIEAQIMELHHAKHQQAYVNGLNAALEKYPALFTTPLHELLKNLETVPADIRTAVRNHGGGVENHTFFWSIMTPKGGGQPRGPLADAIKEKFGDFAGFKSELETAAKNCFGSGWAWLVIEKNGDLAICATPNQDNPMSVGNIPILGVDVWEHAYYLQYFNRRADYVTAWWNVVNWSYAQEVYEQAVL